jgi:protein-disulfide isomerase
MAVDDERAVLRVPVTDRDHSQGPADAVLTLVEYGDYECPHCGRAYPIIKEVQRRLGSQLRFVFRNFPLAEMHRHAQNAAEAAEAAATHGEFWEMHDALFEHQRALDDGHLVQYAQALGMDEQQFQRELQSHAHARHVREDFVGGVRSGVNGTPTFFINGLRHDDAWDVETLTEALQAVVKPPAPRRRFGTHTTT